MTMVETRYEHIVRDDDGVALIAGTTMKVVELVLDHQVYGWSAEELSFQHPALTLGQIYSALAYYWDHRDELEEEIERRYATVQRIRRATPLTPLHQRLREMGRI